MHTHTHIHARLTHLDSPRQVCAGWDDCGAVGHVLLQEMPLAAGAATKKELGDEYIADDRKGSCTYIKQNTGQRTTNVGIVDRGLH